MLHGMGDRQGVLITICHTRLRLTHLESPADPEDVSGLVVTAL